MKNTIFGSALAMLCCVAATSAQQQAQTTTKAEPAHKVYVLTGCLEAGADPTVAFKLTDASAIGLAPPAAAAEPEPIGTSGRKVSYELQPVSGVNAQGMNADALKAHAGHRVEVTVRPAEVAPAAAPTPPAAGVQAARPVEPPVERFTVTAIKQVAGACS